MSVEVRVLRALEVSNWLIIQQVTNLTLDRVHLSSQDLPDSSNLGGTFLPCGVDLGHLELDNVTFLEEVTFISQTGDAVRKGAGIWVLLSSNLCDDMKPSSSDYNDRDLLKRNYRSHH